MQEPFVLSEDEGVVGLQEFPDSQLRQLETLGRTRTEALHTRTAAHHDYPSFDSTENHPNQRCLQLNGDLHVEDDFWKLRWRGDLIHENGEVKQHGLKPSLIGPATGPGRLTQKQAMEIAWEKFLLRLDPNAPLPQSAMTVADFVKERFVPEHVAKKSFSGRTHYRAMLKHVLTPTAVDDIFQIEGASKTRLKAVPNWPYMDDVQLRDARPDDVERLIAAALEHGYSTQTIKHIWNLVNVIFECAKKERCYRGDNPASQVKVPTVSHKEAHKLSLRQVEQVLEVMRYPEKEMTLIALLTGMNMAETCGLQWKMVNLTEAFLDREGESIPTRSISIVKQWYGGELANVAPSRKRHLLIPEPLFPILHGLRHRAKFTGPDDLVIVGRAGSPINHGRFTRRLKAIGKDLQMPWLSWQALHRTHGTLAYELRNTYLADHSQPTAEAISAWWRATCADTARHKRT
ncbi:MAG: hypothetical protein WBW33_13345 [Bryobacteraceae bacterium]